MAIQYLNAKRIRGSSTGAKTSADFEETFSGAGHTSDGTTVNGWTTNDISGLKYEGSSGTGLTGVATFDGDDKVTLGGSNTDYNFFNDTFSIAFWLKPDALSNNNTIFDNTNGSASVNGLVIRFEDSEMKITFMQGKSGGGATVKSDGNEMELHEWQHLAFTCDGTTGKIYRNGSLIKSGSMGSYSGTANAVPAIGDCISGGDSGYDGQIQDFVITNDTLTSAEVLSLSGGSVASVLGTSGNNQKIHYPLTTNFNDAVSSGGLGNGTASGNASINTTAKGKQGDCLHFNIRDPPSNDAMYYDLQHADALNGSNANATAWTLRFKVHMDSKNSSSTTQNGTQFTVGLSSVTAFGGARDFMGIFFLQSHQSSGDRVVNATINGGYPQNTGSSGNYLGGASQSINMPSGSDWWVDITRDGDDCTCTIYEDEFTGTSYTKTITASGIADLRYIHLGGYSSETVFVGNIDDIKFYDGGMTQDEKSTLLDTSTYGQLVLAGGISGNPDTKNFKITLNPLQGVTAGGTSGSAFTIAFWVKTNAFASNDAFMGTMDGASSNGDHFQIRANDSDGLEIMDGLTDAKWGSDFTRASFNDNAWHHIALTRPASSNVVTAYLDGVDKGDENYTGRFNSNVSNTIWLNIGGRGDNTDVAPAMSIQDMGFWTREVSGADIAVLATGKPIDKATLATVYTSDLVSYYKFDGDYLSPVGSNTNDNGVNGSGVSLASSGGKFDSYSTSDIPENSVFEEIDTRKYFFMQSNKWNYVGDAPNGISGLYAWYDASDSSTITLTSSAVSTWANKEGTTARDLIQSNGGYRPVVISAQRNGKDVVDMADSNDSMYTTGGAITLAMPITICAVAKMPSNDSAQHFLWSEYGSAPTFEKNSSNNTFNFTFGNQIQWTGGGDAVGNYVDFTCIANGSSSSMRYNNTEVATGTATGSFDLFAIGNHGGMRGGTGGGSLNGSTAWVEEICEIVIFNKALSASELTTMHDYLKEKWDL